MGSVYAHVIAILAHRSWLGAYLDELQLGRDGREALAVTRFPYLIIACGAIQLHSSTHLWQHSSSKVLLLLLLLLLLPACARTQPSPLYRSEKRTQAPVNFVTVIVHAGRRARAS